MTECYAHFTAESMPALLGLKPANRDRFFLMKIIELPINPLTP